MDVKKQLWLLYGSINSLFKLDFDKQQAVIRILLLIIPGVIAYVLLAAVFIGIFVISALQVIMKEIYALAKKDFHVAIKCILVIAVIPIIGFRFFFSALAHIVTYAALFLYNCFAFVCTLGRIKWVNMIFEGEEIRMDAYAEAAPEDAAADGAGDAGTEV